MSDIDSTAVLAAAPAAAPPPALPQGALGAWWAQGARAACLMRPSWAGLQATPAVVACLYLVPLAWSVLVERLYIDGPANFYAPALLADGGLDLTLTLFACWLLLRGRAPNAAPPPDAASLFAMICAQALPVGVVLSLVFVPLSRSGSFTAEDPLQPLGYGAWALAMAWGLGSRALLMWRAGDLGRRSKAVLIALVVGISLAHQMFMPLRHWYPARPENVAPPEPRLRLTQERVEAQSQALADELQALRPQRPGVVDMYVLTFAPDANAVFRRESAVVAEVMGQRFDAVGRTVELVSHRDEAARPAWATLLNLRRALKRVAALMNRDEDVLFIHLSSHGARNAELVPDFWPLHVEPLTPALLKQWLDEEGIRWRVVSVSACYSGSWIAPLSGDGTLVLTAADADHTSYGCGRRSEMTFFGRAMYDEQLRRTGSFEQAHAAARTVIAQREKAAGKEDGFSNPQIAVGAGIARRLQVLQAQQERAQASPAGR